MRASRYPDHEVDKINWQVIKLLWPYLLEYKTRIGFAFICLVLTKLASVYLPFILKDVVDTLDERQNTELVIVPFALVVAYGVVRLSTVLFAELRDTLFGRVTERAIRRIGLKVFQHLHQLDLDFHLSRQTGGLSRDIDRGNSGISFLMRFLVFSIVPTLLEIILVIGILFVNYGIWYALVTASSIIIYVTYSVCITNWRTRYIRKANKADSSSNSRAIDSLLNYETVKYFTNEQYEADAYDEQLAHWESAKAQNRWSLFTLNVGQAAIISLSMTLMLALAAYDVSHSKMTLGDFVLINAFMMQLFIPLNFLGFVYREIKGSLANIEQMFGLLLKKPKVSDQENADELDIKSGEITFSKVYFSYDNKRPILKGVSFTLPAGKKLAVVGDSGSGKSTLVKLLFRFYDCQSGEISIDGQAINSVTQSSLRHNIGIVPQDTVLFNDSLFNNIHYGNPQASTEQVNKAIEMANLSSLVERLPEGHATMVGERGLKLSGGEKQRVAIARTILKDPAILVFDEATSSLDSHSEQYILKAINQVSADRTSLVIAHRLSTIVDADNILVLKEGEVIEQGDHHSLLEQDNYYAKMWRLQQASSNTLADVRDLADISELSDNSEVNEDNNDN